MKKLYISILLTLVISNTTFAENSETIGMWISHIDDNRYPMLIAHYGYVPLDRLPGYQDAERVAILKPNEGFKIPNKKGYYINVSRVNGWDGYNYTTQDDPFFGICNNYNQVMHNAKYVYLMVNRIDNIRSQCKITYLE